MDKSDHLVLVFELDWRGWLETSDSAYGFDVCFCVVFVGWSPSVDDASDAIDFVFVNVSPQGYKCCSESERQRLELDELRVSLEVTLTLPLRKRVASNVERVVVANSSWKLCHSC